MYWGSLSQVIDWFRYSLMDGLTNWLTDWLTDWPKQWNWRSGFVTDRPPYRDTWERHLPQWSSLWWRGGTVPKTERIKGALKFDGNIFMNKLLVNKWMNRLFSRISLVLLEEWITKIVVVKQANKVVRLIQNWLSWGKLSFWKSGNHFSKQITLTLFVRNLPTHASTPQHFGSMKKSTLSGKFYHEYWFDFFSVFLFCYFCFSTYFLVYSVTPWLSLCKRMNTISLKNQSHLERLVPQ